MRVFWGHANLVKDLVVNHLAPCRHQHILKNRRGNFCCNAKRN